MDRATLKAIPVSYAQPFQPFRAAPCFTRRTGLGSPSFIDLNKSRPVPSGFVSELRSQYSPACVEHGFRHPCFGELGRADIADYDQGVFAGKPRRRLVKLVFARVGNLGVDRTSAALVSGPLRNGKRDLVFSIMTQSRDGRAIAQRGERLKPQVDANTPIASRKIVGNFALENYIPAPARILRKASRFETVERDLARFPEPEFALEISHLRPVYLDSARNKWHPAEGALGAKTRAEARTFALGITRCNKLSANGRNGIGMNAEKPTRSAAETYQVEGAWPSCRAPSLPARFGLPLNLTAVIPDLIGCIGMANEVLTRRSVFDSVFIAKDQGYRLSLWASTMRLIMSDTEIPRRFASARK